ncbi:MULTISPECIES: MarR family winged helix-turn-helix transcriptional regulator [Thermomonospora]|uniref:Transcriptional regulator, MarR family n=1 Tax=Thermomonospora curvata (strain ATCC 19995 / DSM 43183 / JCM 3096 / KCTC 9072 / NBRC 15933 / NCIMB 10081 / Henssen B9) TaxID=471852 RepID=D1AEC7_THECD|nr:MULTISPECIES: MarR family transcriptional regulator [Thermomonospora]ACY95743.1 transcriptional regulator, MarR family [Thermomonospora curvata DSM 43183]PKK16327.1 MAG: MarR family transcriptional regulator [Thermomonospora sp. CIF 1]
MSEPRWLDAGQQRDWRAYIDGSTRLHELLDRDLKAKHGLSTSEYEILVRLSEAPGRALRMAELAEHASQSRSRLSHTCTRLESKGLVRREACPNDKRGVYAILTDEGFAALERAARDHVETVRRFFVDVISPEDLKAIGRAFGAVDEHIRGVR